MAMKYKDVLFYFQIITLILICIFFLLLHLIINEIVWKGWVEMEFFGVFVPSSLLFDLILLIIILLLFIEVILVLSNEIERIKRVREK